MFVTDNRIFLYINAPATKHNFLKSECVWQGSDKTWDLNGMKYLGYEFSPNGFSLGELVDKINAL